MGKDRQQAPKTALAAATHRSPEDVVRGRTTRDRVEGRLYEETPDGVTTNG